MPDWKQYVREHLAPLQLASERELEMVEEMAQHLEAAYEDALDGGASEQEAYRRAAAHIKDWRLLECELIRAKRPITHVWVNRRLAPEARIGYTVCMGPIGALLHSAGVALACVGFVWFALIWHVFDSSNRY